MAIAPLRFAIIASCLLAQFAPAAAQFPEATPAEQQFAALEARYAPSPAAPPSASKVIQQAAYVGPANSAAGPTLPSPASAQPAAAPAQTSIFPAPQNAQEIISSPPSDAWCLPPQPPCRTSSWTAAVEFLLTQTHVTRADFGQWPDEDTLGLRLILGYEDPRGLGVRGRVWGLDQDVSAEVEDVQLEARAFDLDLYKRFFIDDSELALGGGFSSRGLEFEQPGNGYSRYSGGGLSLFAEGFVPLLEFPNSVIGQVGRARVALTTGNWKDTTDQLPNGAPAPGNIVPGTDHDSLTTTEFAWGLEYRHRFGSDEDHLWYIALLGEHQRWQSDWMGAFMGTSVSFTGLNLNTGVSW